MCAGDFHRDPGWVKKSIAELQTRFKQGMEFIVVAPVFQTLRQQILERIVKAGLAQGDSNDVVNPYSWASKASLFVQCLGSRNSANSEHCLVGVMHAQYFSLLSDGNMSCCSLRIVYVCAALCHGLICVDEMTRRLHAAWKSCAAVSSCFAGSIYALQRPS